MLLGLVISPLLLGLFGLIFQNWLAKSTFACFTSSHSSQNHHGFARFKTRFFYEVHDHFAFWIALFSALLTILFLIYWVFQAQAFSALLLWKREINYSWISLIGVRFHLRLDSISLIMCILTSVISLIAILYSYQERRENSGLFYLSLLSLNAFTMMLLSTQDLFLFFLVWEATTFPFYFLMVLWGKRSIKSRIRFIGASKFIIYTQISAIIMLIAILILVLKNQALTGIWTFDYIQLSQTPISIYLESSLLFCFLIAFFIRMPLFPFHGWFIETHQDASTTSSIMLSGLFCTSTIYCLIKFVFPIFPNAFFLWQTEIMILSLVTTFFGALACFKATKTKPLIAYAHFSLIGLINSIIFCCSFFALQGVILVLIGISFTITGLFILSHFFTSFTLLNARPHKKETNAKIKILAALMLIFVLLLTGLPGSANFTGFLLMTIGSFAASPYYVVCLVFALLLLMVALLLRVQPLFYGQAPLALSQQEHKNVTLQMIILIAILAIVFCVGLMPQWILDMSDPWLYKIKMIIQLAEFNLARGEI